MFNIYVSDTKRSNDARLTEFPGFSAGEVRSFLSDLFARDLKKNNYRCFANFPEKHIRHKVEEGDEKSVTTALKTLDIATMTEKAESILYDRMNAQELITTVWVFSDKTLIIVKV